MPCELMGDAVCLRKLYRDDGERIAVRLVGVKGVLDCILSWLESDCSCIINAQSEPGEPRPKSRANRRRSEG